MAVTLVALAAITTVVLTREDRNGSSTTDHDAADQHFVGVLTGHTDTVGAVTTAQRDGRTVVVSASDDGSIRLWDLASGQPLGPPLADREDRIETLTTGERDGRIVIVSGGTKALRLWDLATGRPVGEPLTGCSAEAVTTAQREGRTVVVAGCADNTIHVWELP